MGPAAWPWPPTCAPSAIGSCTSCCVGCLKSGSTGWWRRPTRRRGRPHDRRQALLSLWPGQGGRPVLPAPRGPAAVALLPALQPSGRPGDPDPPAAGPDRGRAAAGGRPSPPAPMPRPGPLGGRGPMIGPQVRRHPAPGGGLAVLVVVTVLAALAAPNAKALRGLVADGRAVIAAPATPAAPAIRRPTPGAARAVAFVMRQRGKPYRWGAGGPGAFDCSGLTWEAWRAAGVAISPDRGRPARRPPPRQGSAAAWRSAHLCQPRPVAAACGDGGRPGPDGRGPRSRHPRPLHQHPSRLPG